jgi:hypothetical protein
VSQGSSVNKAAGYGMADQEFDSRQRHESSSIPRPDQLLPRGYQGCGQRVALQLSGSAACGLQLTGWYSCMNFLPQDCGIRLTNESETGGGGLEWDGRGKTFGAGGITMKGGCYNKVSLHCIQLSEGRYKRVKGNVKEGGSVINRKQPLIGGMKKL